MSLILPPEKLESPVALTVQRGNIGVLFRLQDVRGDIPVDLGEVVIPWSKLPSLIDKLTEWKTDSAPKHHHLVIDPAALGAAVNSLGG